jgi:predicted metal-dependent hydrolase
VCCKTEPVEQERPLVLLMDDHRLEVRLPGCAQPSEVKSALAKWYKRHAQGHFPQRMEYYAAQLNLRKMPRLFVSNATTRWGSCNAQREIRLSWRLMQAAPGVIDYVVAHEVAHIIQMNHSPKFWSVVEKLCPGYAGARAELNALTRHYMSL